MLISNQMYPLDSVLISPSRMSNPSSLYSFQPSEVKIHSRGIKFVRFEQNETKALRQYHKANILEVNNFLQLK